MRKQGRGIIRSSLLNPEACRPTGDVEHDHATPAFRLYLLLASPLFLSYLARRQADEPAGRPLRRSFASALLCSISADEPSKVSVTFRVRGRCVHVREEGQYHRMRRNRASSGVNKYCRSSLPERGERGERGVFQRGGGIIPRKGFRFRIDVTRESSSLVFDSRNSRR